MDTRSTGSGIQKGNGSGGFAGAVSGTDYAPATSGSSPLKGNGVGGFSAATAADIVGIFSTCSGTQYLGADNACHTLATVATTGSAADLGSGTLPAGRLPALSGDVSSSAGSASVTVTKLNGTSLAGLATCILKNTTATGMPSIATAGTDYAGLASTNTMSGYNDLSGATWRPPEIVFASLPAASTGPCRVSVVPD